MRGAIRAVSGICALFLAAGMIATHTDAGDRAIDRSRRFTRPWAPGEFASEDLPGWGELLAPAQVDTYLTVFYDFEIMNWQGWTRLDLTAQRGAFWHVDDFSGLGGGLESLEGAKSMWCGARPDGSEYLCSWASAPGYGNGWHQMLRSQPILNVSGLMTFSYRGRFDSEPGADRTRVQYQSGFDEWTDLAVYDGTVDTVATHTINVTAVGGTKLRIYFESDDAWSDEDGYYDSDGAAIIDSITVIDDSGLIDFEDFESAGVGDTATALWYGEVRPPFGTYSGLYGNLMSNDPCNSNPTTQIVFWIGEGVEPADDFPVPGLNETPFCQGPGSATGPCQDEMVVSPVIDLTRYSAGGDNNQDAAIPPGELPGLGGILLRFGVFDYLPVSNLVFYEWRVRDVQGGCPGPWKAPGFWIPYSHMGYYYSTNDISLLVGSDSIQVGFRVVDMCEEWYGTYGDCADHTPAPWFDNVKLQRCGTEGPAWSWRDLDLFQDSFPEEEFNIESYVRADAANDINPNSPLYPIRPGDSIVVDCDSPFGGGIAEDAFGPRVYMHLRCSYIGTASTPKPDLAGPSLEGSCGRYASDDGIWTIIQGDTARSAAGGKVAGRYMFDLNDSLLTRGYEIEYYFKAYDNEGYSSTLPWDAEQEWFANGMRNRFEFTTLPTLEHEILFVDDFHGRGTLDGIVQHYYQYGCFGCNPMSFAGPLANADRYDVNSPSSRVSNGPGSRAKIEHLKTAYTTIIWDSGNLESCTISDGSADSDKSGDCMMLIDWMDLSEHACGLWVSGDDVAQDLAGLGSAQAIALLSTWCGVTLANGSYFELTGGMTGGGVTSPIVRAVPGSAFDTSDSFYVFGGCPVINRFDVLDVTNYGQYALQYPDHEATQYYAGVQSAGTNSQGHTVRTMWFGFSFMYIRDAYLDFIRQDVMYDVLSWMGNSGWSSPTPAERTPAVYSLSQNHPNPFNPVTDIRFSLRERGLVTVRIYDVAGRLVRTLVDEVRDAGAYREAWDGRNNRGASAASGVYFYRMESKSWSATRKMVLLK